MSEEAIPRRAPTAPDSLFLAGLINGLVLLRTADEWENLLEEFPLLTRQRRKLIGLIAEHRRGTSFLLSTLDEN
jgi:hypothetical protein